MAIVASIAIFFGLIGVILGALSGKHDVMKFGAKIMAYGSIGLLVSLALCSSSSKF